MNMMTELKGDCNGLDRVLTQMADKVATVTLKKWIASALKKDLNAEVMFRRLDILEVHRESYKAVEVTFRFSRDIAASCNICCLDLDTDVSRATGIGPTCAKKLGVPRASKDDASAILAFIDTQVTKFGTKRAWIPKSQFTVDSGVVKGPAPVARPAPVLAQLAPGQIQVAAWFAKKENMPEVVTVIRKLKETAKWVLVRTNHGEKGIPKSVIVGGTV